MKVSVLKHIIRRLWLVIVLISAIPAFAQTGDLPRSTPEQQGVPSEALIRFFDAITSMPDGAEVHSAMVLRHGKVIGEIYPAPFSPEYKQTLYSCSKTFVAAAIGLAVEQNLLRVTDRVATFFGNDLPAEISPALAEMTVADLLTMSSGIVPDWSMRNNHRNWLATWLAKPVVEPGRKFAYDSIDTYALSAIVQKVTGMTTLEYLRNNVFDPLGVDEVEWEESPEGINTGGWGLYIQPESMAKFGQLLLDKGRWNGEQVLPENWVKLMMTPHIRANAAENYGYQMWECRTPGAWRADGAFGQYIIVMPEQDMVVVLTQCSSLGAKGWAPVDEILVPALSSEPLEPSADAERLARRRYALQPAHGKSSNANGRLVDGKVFTLSPNSLEWKRISFTLEKNRLMLRVSTNAGQTYDIPCGYDSWETARTPVCPPYSIKAVDRFRGITRDFAVSGSYAWLPDGTLWLRIFYPSWITGVNMTLNPRVNTMTVKENILPKPYTVRLTPAGK